MNNEIIASIIFIVPMSMLYFVCWYTIKKEKEHEHKIFTKEMEKRDRMIEAYHYGLEPDAIFYEEHKKQIDRQRLKSHFRHIRQQETRSQEHLSKMFGSVEEE